MGAITIASWVAIGVATLALPMAEAHELRAAEAQQASLVAPPTPQDRSPSDQLGWQQSARTAQRSPEPLATPQAEPIAPQVERPIKQVTVDVAAPAGRLPENIAARALAAGTIQPLAASRTWPASTFRWEAAATRHQPLYFEEINAERYGYTRCAWLQPAVSSAHFFGTLPMLPYLRGANPHWQCQYTLGHYRPGSCNPWRRHWWPLSAKGAARQAAAVTGAVYVLP
jgi:hypothetical protein